MIWAIIAGVVIVSGTVAIFIVRANNNKKKKEKEANKIDLKVGPITLK